MPLSRNEVADTIVLMCQRWNAADRAGWLSMFRDDVTIEDPVGSRVRRGRAAAESTWDVGFSYPEPWTMVPGLMVVCGNRAAVTFSHMSTVDGRPYWHEDIEVWELDDDRRVVRVQAYFEPPASSPDYYFEPPEEPASADRKNERPLLHRR
ncbi:MAG: nuclear transport factor 2 family protein [Myxococcota bacterium]